MDMASDKCLQTLPLFNHCLNALIHFYDMCERECMRECMCVTAPECTSVCSDIKETPTPVLLCMEVGQGLISARFDHTVPCGVERSPLVCDTARHGGRGCHSDEPRRS